MSGSLDYVELSEEEVIYIALKKIRELLK